MIKDKQITIQVFDRDIIREGMTVEWLEFGDLIRAKIKNVFDELIEVIDENNHQRFFDTEEVIEYKIRVVRGGK